MPASFVEDVEFTVHPNHMHMRTWSGSAQSEHIIPIATFIANHWKAADAIAAWRLDYGGEVVPIQQDDPPGHHHVSAGNADGSPDGG